MLDFSKPLVYLYDPKAKIEYIGEVVTRGEYTNVIKITDVYRKFFFLVNSNGMDGFGELQKVANKPVYKLYVFDREFTDKETMEKHLERCYDSPNDYIIK